jgi:hypothetical protein
LVSPVPVANLLSVMTATFDRAAESVTGLFAAQDVVLPRLIEIESRLGAIDAQALALKMPAPPRIGDVRAQVHGLRRDLLEDPLSVDLGTVRDITAETDRLGAGMQCTERAAAELSGAVAMLETALGERVSAITAVRPVVEAAERLVTTYQTAIQDPPIEDRLS